MGQIAVLPAALSADRLLETDRTSLALWIPFPCTLTGLSGGWSLCKMANGARDIARQIPGLKSQSPPPPNPQTPCCSRWRVKTLTSLSAHVCQAKPVLPECLIRVKTNSMWLIYYYIFFSLVKIDPLGCGGRILTHKYDVLYDVKDKSQSLF